MLYLASNSPRRRQLLGLTGWQFGVQPADIDETPEEGESPARYVVRLAESKARAAAKLLPSLAEDALVIASDTTVVDGQEILGKPVDPADAVQMLRRLRGRVHQVYTGIAVLRSGDHLLRSDLCVTDVVMRSYSDEEIREYVATGDPLDKAGSYAIQHPGFHPVERITGCFASVMGLPLCRLVLLLRPFGWDTENDLIQTCLTSLQSLGPEEHCHRGTCAVAEVIFNGEP